MIVAGAGLSVAGWVFMLCSLGFVVGLTVFCFSRVLGKRAGGEGPLRAADHEADR